MNPIKKICILVIVFIMLFPSSTFAYSGIPTVETDLSKQSLIEIVDPHIVENNSVYSIINEKELINKIGIKNVQSLKEYLVIASNENSVKNAVNDIHIAILRDVGASVSKHWWGTKILTPSQNVAIKVRDLASAFSTQMGDAAMLTALLLAGVGFIPGYGSPAAIAGIVVGIWGWADARTWSTVSSLMSTHFVSNRYLLTIDINKWIMEVKVYP
jgi:hypothetical protein